MNVEWLPNVGLKTCRFLAGFALASFSKNCIGSIIDKDYIQVSHIAQRLFESLPINKITRAQLFPTEEIRKAFDTNLIAALHTIIDDEIVSRRTSNKHPLKIQFLA